MPDWSNTIPSAYPGSGAFRDALNFYGNQAFGPYNTGAGDLAMSGAYDQAGGNYYGAPTAPAATGGAGQESAQGKFAQLLQGQSGARNAGDLARAQSLVSGMKGTEGVAESAGSSMAQQIASIMALKNSQAQAGAQQIGMGLGTLSSFASPTGPLSNILNAFTGGKTSGLSQTVGAGSSGLSSLMSFLKTLFGGGGSGVLPIDPNIGAPAGPAY